MFRDEALETVDVLAVNLERLRDANGPDTRDAIDTAFRHAHNLKGAARMVGQDVAFAASWAASYGNVAGVLRAIRSSLQEHIELAAEHRPLDAGSGLAASHGTRYPIVQGPMTRVSDTAGFAQAFWGLATGLSCRSRLPGPLVHAIGWCPNSLRKPEVPFPPRLPHETTSPSQWRCCWF